MKNFTNNFKQFTSRLSARWLIMALMMLVGTSSVWGANLSSGQFIQFKFSQGSVSQNSGWNETVLNMWDNNGNSKQVNVQPGEVYTISEGHWIPTKFQYLSQYDYSGWKGKTAEIGDCGGEASLQPNTCYFVTLNTSTNWIGTQYQNYPNKEFKHSLSCTTVDPCETKYYVASGTLPGASWDAGKHLEMNTCEGGLRSLTFNGVAAGNYEFKITQGNWNWSTGSYYTDKGNLTCSSGSDGNIKISTNNLGVTNITIYFDGTKAYASYTAACTTINDLDITASKTSICDGESVTLTLNNKQSGVTYKIGNTTIFNSSDAKPTYNTGAITGVSKKSYTIDATATDQCEAKTKTIEITVNSIPATPTFDPAPSYCAGDEITLPIKDNAKNTVTWYDEQGNAAGNPATTAGTYTYKAKATNTNGCVSEDYGTYQYTVKPKVGLDWNEISTSMPINNTQNITTTLTGTGNVDYTSSDNTVISVSGSTLKALKEGKATIKATATGTGDYCGTATITKDVTVTCVTVKTPNVTASDICSGSTATLTLNNRQDGVTYKLNSTTGTPIFTSGENDYTTPVLNDNTTYTIYASHASACTNNVEGSVTVTVVSAPQTPSLSTNINMLNNTNKTATLTIGNYVEGVTYTLYKDNNSTGNTTTSTTFSVTAGGVYKVKGTNSNNPSGCQDTDFSEEITINVCPTPAKPVLTSTAVTTCNSNVTTFGSITITNMENYKDDKYTFKLGDRTANPDANGKIVISSAANTKYTVTVTNSCGNSNSAEVEIAINNITPTISGATIAQPGKQNKIELTVPNGITAKWSVSPEADLSVSEGNSTMFSAEKNGRYTITATNGTCSDTHVVTVADAFYIYFRNAKKGETAYANFYDPNQNTEDVQGGEMFYAECDALPTNGNNSLPTHFVNYNKGGRKADIITTDCDGYTWYGFKASAEVVAGTKYFYVHATNDKNYNGHFTHTVPTKKTLTSDVYYTLGTTNHTTTHYGWNITLASAPYAGPKVHASGSTTLGTDKFAALYVTDCSGKEITGYQWYKDGQPYSSVCSYVGKKGAEDSNAGETNNIRPTVAGNYSCTVTYEGGTTATSAAVPVTGTYSRSFTSNIPVLVVNTGGKGFPDCTGISGQTASLNASKFKAKRSVDVKIYEGETLVYDRKARMNYRGSSSLNFVKKSYAFCPGDANCGDKDKGEDYVKTAKLNMLGVGTACDKDWVLYAAAADPSLMRNRLVFDSYNAMTGKWGVNSRYVELIINGEYKGVYVFMDKITMNENRVEVNEDKGFIVKFDKTDREDRVGGYNDILGDEKTFKTSRTGKDDIKTYDTYIDQRFEIEYPEKDDYKTGWKARVDGIQGMFQAFEDALKQGDYATVQKYIDYTSWADWFIINEFTKNVDAYRASCIFVYTGEAGAKIEARPLWDQELSFNNQASKGTSDKGSDSTTGLLIQNSNVYSDDFKAPFWFTGDRSDITGGLLSDPCFVQVVKERWNIHQLGALSKKSLEDLVDEYEDDLAPEGTTENALTRETAFWDGKSRGNCDCSYDTGNATATGYQNKTFAESTGTITSWIADGAGGRREGLTTAINGLTGASFSIQILPLEVKTTPWEPVEITVSVTPAGYDYKLEYTGDNNLGGVANTIIKEEGDKITYRIPRPSDWGVGDAEEGARADIEYGIKATLSVQEGTTVCGSQAAPSSTAKIILQDEDNDNCK